MSSKIIGVLIVMGIAGVIAWIDVPASAQQTNPPAAKLKSQDGAPPAGTAIELPTTGMMAASAPQAFVGEAGGEGLAWAKEGNVGLVDVVGQSSVEKAQTR